ncbi:hypothetical protein JKF63_04737 [Porcisia hertigi]|uniref:Uncharacterized protein n=1 Tax=Porcisia hertigi TaxID=2761500 RepID=A0A836I140_9TRYP|nr:hypothetical protein JKF63_04737 [Porcisia hertigi]
MGPAHDTCGFFYGGDVSQRHRNNARSAFVPLSHTWVMPELLANSTVTFLDAIFYTDGSGEAVAQVWLRVNPGNDAELDAALSSSSLVAACRVPLGCPSRTDIPVINAAAVLTGDATPAVGQFHFVYPCVSGADTSLREMVHRWDGGRLSMTRKRALLSVTDTRAPYIATAVVSEFGTAGFFVVVSGGYHRPDAFYVRTDAAARQGLIPPVRVLQIQALLTQTERHRSLRHGCLTESLVGLVVYEPYRQRSIFSLAAVPSVGEKTLYDEVRTVMEMSTATLHEADEAFIPCCGLAQRLVYSECALTRTQLHAFPLLEVTQVALTVRVEGALSRPASLSPMSNVTWQLCGSQRYETTVSRRQRALEGQLSWLVEPFRTVSSSKRCVEGASEQAPAAEVTARGVIGAHQRFQTRCVTCVSGGYSSSLMRQEGPLIGGVDCGGGSLALSVGASCSTYPDRSNTVETMHASRICRRITATWWQPPPLWVSRTACRRIHHSLFELSALYILVVVVCLLFHLLLRARGKGKGVTYTKVALAL